MFRLPRIAVFSSGQSLPSERLFRALGWLHSVEFVSGQEMRADLYDAALMFGATREDAVRAASSGLRCMAFLGGEPRQVRSGSSNIRLSSVGYLDRSLRELVLADTGFEHILPAEVQPGDQVVAWQGDDALWIHRTEESSSLDLVAVDPPDLREGEELWKHFTKGDWMRLLPLMHFVRELSGWKPPAPRACFIFDDPNLHWKSYGYIRYEQLFDHALQHDYHVAFATVPLDSWYIHPATARFFRTASARLSLLMHGNNHTRHELGNGGTEQSRRATVAKALLRTRRLEEEYGLPVARVMAAPHDCCDHRMGDVLMRMGFDALFYAISSPQASNPSSIPAITVGLNPAEFIGDGMAVIRRFKMRRDPLPTPRFLAFLGQPIIFAGHHDDLAGGLDLLEQLSALINSIPGMQWMDMKAIAETNFSRWIEGDRLRVKMFSRSIRVKIPEGVRHLSVHRPWVDENRTEGLTVLRSAADPECMDRYECEFLPVVPGEEVVLKSVSPDFIDPHNVAISRTPLWAIVRRQLAEVRDRAKPITDRLSGRNSTEHA